MTDRKPTLLLCAAACFALLAAAGHLPKPDYEAVAERLISQSANVQEGDKVYISGSTRDLELLENIAVHVRKRGAHPIIVIGSDRLTRRMFMDVSEKYDEQSPGLGLALAEVFDVMISVDYGEDPELLADIAPERFAKRSKTWQPVSKRLIDRGVKQINLGNDLYPTKARAEEFGVPQTTLSEMFWSGVNVDYGLLQATGESVRKMLAGGKEIRVTNPNGTDLRLQVTGRKVYVSDGMISDEDVKDGGAALNVWLPAGEVFVTPVAGTAQGTVVIDRYSFQGTDVTNLRLDIKDGKLTAMSADSGLEPLKRFYDAAGEGKDVFAAVDIGINPNVRIVPGSKMVAWMPAGMVTVGIGNNEWAGGENSAGFGLFGHIPGSTLTVDGTTVVEKGELKVRAMAPGG